MEKPRRDNLREVVQSVRRKVEGSLQRQLVAFGLLRDAAPIPREDLPLRDDQQPLYERLRDAVLREGRAVGADGSITARAVDRFIREAGATWVNRLAALRAMEERGLLEPPAAFVSADYGGVSPRADRLRDAAATLGNPLTQSAALRAGIEDACRELSEHVRVLFDLGDEHSLLWPDAATLRDVLGELSESVTREDWAQPDVLGWVYQYYNTQANAELKKRKNKEKGFKYQPDDIPIANQFYSPHWVVRVLTDNTLGRLWLESRDRVPLATLEPWQVDERRRAVPSATADVEGFRAWFLEEPGCLRDGTVDRLCRFLVPLPSQPLPRPRKPVREIRVLDPACGSGHFLLYAFELLFAMYREEEPDLDPREIPALILEHNLFGIDIDLRAAQLAAFGLYLKARTTLAAIDPAARLTVRGLNIVVADAHIGEDPRKAAFLERYRAEPQIRQLYERILTNLDHTNVLGSLLKVRTEFEVLAGRVREAQEQPAAASFDIERQRSLVDIARQRQLRDVFATQSGRQWSIQELLDELRQFEREVAPSQDIGARLFYSDLERSVGLLALLSESYDVVLMNPPYGDMPAAAKDYLGGNKKKKVEARYTRTAGDLYAAFLEQGIDLLHENGFLGALVPWTYTFQSGMEPLRTQILAKEARPEFLQEYGYGILDGATVGTVGTIARRLPLGDSEAALQHTAVFERLSGHKKDWEKQDEFLATFPAFVAQGPDREQDWFAARLASLADVPGMPYAYWASDSLRALFRSLPPLDRDQDSVTVAGRPSTKVADVRQGLATADDGRFVRFWWEVPQSTVGQGRRWVPFLKGGQEVAFFARTDLVVNWDTEGREIKDHIVAAYPYLNGKWEWVAKNTAYYFRAGVTWPRVSWRLRKFGTYPTGCIFADKGSSVFGLTLSSEAICGLLNSSTGATAMLMQTPERMWEIGTVAAVPIPVGNADPIVPSVETLTTIERRRHAGDETSREANGPHLRDTFRSLGTALNLEAALGRERTRCGVEAEQRERWLKTLDETAFELYGVSPADRQVIARELARRSQPVASEPEGGGDVEADDEDDPEAGGAPSQSDAELVRRWVSFYAKQVLENDPDGIVPVHATRTEPALIVRVREVIEKDLGVEDAKRLMEQAPAYLGTETVAEWIEGAYFPWHVELYQNRPLFWLVSSENFAKGPTRFTFQAYLHCLKLTPDTLPRLVTYYLEESLDHARNQWHDAKLHAARVEGRAQKAAQKETQEWLNTVDALEAFKRALESIVRGPERAEKVPDNAKWLARTIAAVRGGQDLGHGYRPNVDHGVKVNIKPLAEARLLPRSVLKKLGG